MESSFASSLNDQNFQLSASKMLRPRQPLRAVSTPVTRLEIIGSLDVPRSPPQYAARPPLLDWSFLAPWQQDNHYILTGYRVPSHSYRGSIQSLFYLHNEFVNIHSHMLGAFVFLGIFLCLYAFTDQPIDMADVVVFACFALGAIYCLSISATFHLLMNHSPSVCCFMNQLDYVGIAALITGSFVPSMYYGFYCEPLLRKSYLTMVSGLESCKHPLADRSCLDLHNRDWLYNCVYKLGVSNSIMENISRVHVPCYGLICDSPCGARCCAFGRCADGETDGFVLGHLARLSLRDWCHHLRCESI